MTLTYNVNIIIHTKNVFEVNNWYIYSNLICKKYQ